MRWPGKLSWTLTPGLGAILLPGCLLGPGQPWAVVEASLQAAFQPPASRLTETGELETDNSYAIALESIEVTLGELVVTQQAEDALSFDPADPPPGYSNCHAGHCHAEDGSLVDYADIEAGLSGGATAPQLAIHIDAEVALSEEPVPVELEPCPGGCTLEIGPLASLSLSLHGLEVAGRVFDPTAQQRLPAEGVAFSGIWSLELRVEVPLEGAADKQTPPVIELDVLFPLTERLFDGMDWATATVDLPPSASLDLAADADLSAALLENLAEHSSLEVDLHRHAL